jgi:hypothetical protein
MRTIDKDLGPRHAFAACGNAAIFNAEADGARAPLRVSGEGEELIVRGEATGQGADNMGEARLARVDWRDAAGWLHSPIVAERWA